MTCFLCRGPQGLALILIVVILQGSVMTQESAVFAGPKWEREPPGLVEFINTRGTQIDCIANGYPTPSVTWISLDNSPLNNITSIRIIQPNGTLIINPFQPEQYRPDVQAATYKCLATNPVGTISSVDIQLRAVLQQPYDVQVFDSYVLEGNSALFKCHVPGIVRDYVKVLSWIRNDNLLIQPKQLGGIPEKYVVMPTGELHITDTTLGDSGSKYRCKTSHRLTGETQISSSAGQLFVTESKGFVPPRITDSVSSVLTNQGATAALPCVSQGHPEPVTRWYIKNAIGHDTLLNPSSRLVQTKSSLFIRDVDPSDVGEYICEVSSELGKEQRNIQLSIVENLHVIVNPEKSLAKLGDEVDLNCEVTGQPINSLHWLHNGETIPNQSEKTFKISNIRSSDQGMYQCVVKNSVGAFQASFELRISEIAPYWAFTFEKVVEQPGNPISIQCKAGGIPLPQISWYLDGVQIDANSHYLISSTTKDGYAISDLQISSAEVIDGGLYSCSAINSVGKITHLDRINIYGPVKVREVPTQMAISGLTLQLNCPFYGYPWDSISWEKDDVPLPLEMRHTVLNNGTLIIRSMHRARDNGKYVCKVKDNNGSSQNGIVQVQVMVPPKIVPFEFQDELLREGMRARLQCVVSDGDLPLTVTWLKDGKAISPDTGILVRNFDEFSSILTITNIMPSHNGNYTCIASNMAATVSHVAELSVNGK